MRGCFSDVPQEVNMPISSLALTSVIGWALSITHTTAVGPHSRGVDHVLLVLLSRPDYKAVSLELSTRACLHTPFNLTDRPVYCLS